MKTFRVLASHIVNSQVEIQANDIGEAYQLARKSKQTLFNDAASKPVWEIDHVYEVQHPEAGNYLSIKRG